MKKYNVIVVDRFFFGEDVLEDFKTFKNLKLIKKDIRSLCLEDMVGVDIVCDLACLSNDPAGEIDSSLTYSINRDGRILVATIAKQSGVRKYIMSSSCSIYGFSENSKLNEESKPNPLSAYAKSTHDAETQILAMANKNFSVTALRNATVFGLSKRMRFDLVVNLMTLTAFQKGKILVMGGGEQWRPLVHVSDVSSAFQKVIEENSLIINQQIFNIGLDNFQIKNLAFLVRESLPISVEVDVAPDDADKRNYNVSFEKSMKILNFKPKIGVEHGIKEIYNALKNNSVDTGIKTVTVQWYKNLLDSKKILDKIMIDGRIF
jgi:nucleoside-diphosphate-sugar epimerase